MPPLLAAVDAPNTPIWAWGIFGALVIGMLALDLLLFNRKAHVQGIREAAIWSAVWVGLALAFNVGVYYWKGPKAAGEFLTAYVLEKSLSVDNLFIFLVIFRYFQVPTMFQHRVLFWGILGALIMRALMIGVGVQIIELFRPILFAFAGFLIFTGIKLFFSDEESHDPSQSWAYKLTRKYIPLTDRMHEEHFFVRVPADEAALPALKAVESAERGGIGAQSPEPVNTPPPVPRSGAAQKFRTLATPLFLVLMVVEATDLAFALDSIPACLAISQDLFVVYTSNIFAILGLRALFFLLSGMMGELRFLKPALSIVLAYIGVKMVLAELHKHHGVEWALEIPTGISLAIVGGIIGLSIVASLLFPLKRAATDPDSKPNSEA